MKFVDILLDKSIYFSFDKSGYKRHYNQYEENIDNHDFTNQKVLITGGTSGIGHSVAQYISQRNGHCIITGRDALKGENASNKLNNTKFIELDMALWDKVRMFAENSPVYNMVVLNAGGMSTNFTLNEYGVEYQAAGQLFGHYYLIKSLQLKKKLSQNCKIIWVTSGGMYLKKLDNDMFYRQTDYDPVKSYANIKRAQVILVQELSKQLDWKDFSLSTMHPGWVDTEGLKVSMPGFYKITKKRLRNAEQGADTICWLLATSKKTGSGHLFFDRNVRDAYPFWWTRESPKQRGKLLELISSYENKVMEK